MMPRMTNFLKVILFNRTANLPVHDRPQYALFDTDPRLIKAKIGLIKEELSELEKAIEDKNLTEVTDALADLLYVTYGLGAIFGINMDEAFKIVHDSNMSKFPSTEEEASATVLSYSNAVPRRYDTPSYRRSVHNPEKFVVYNTSTQKVLKSIKFIQPNFKSILYN